MPPEMTRDYEVGYGKPPLHTRFQKGKSGNPKGRPRGKKNMSTLLSTALNASIVVVANGRRKKITKREAIVTQLVNKSAAADLKATQIVLAMLRELESQDDGSADPAVFTEADHEIIRRIQARLRNEKDEPAMTDLSPSEYNAILRSDLGFFAQRCFSELNPQAAFAPNWHLEVIAAKLTEVRQGKIRRLIINLPPRHLKSLDGLDRLSGLVSRARPVGADPLRQLCPGSRRQARPRLPQHHDEPVVSADLSDPPGASPPGGAGVHHHPPGLPARHLDRRRADRARCRHHPDRRSA